MQFYKFQAFKFYHCFPAFSHKNNHYNCLLWNSTLIYRLVIITTYTLVNDRINNHGGNLMSFITHIIDKELDNVENTYQLVNYSLVDHVGPLSDSKKKAIGASLVKSYLYLYREDIFSFGLIRYLPGFIRSHIVESNPDILVTYKNLRNSYVTPYPRLENYIAFLESITIEKLEKPKREIANFYTHMSNFAHEYIDFNTLSSIKSIFTPLFEKISKSEYKDFFLDFLSYFSDIDNQIKLLNESYVERELIAADALLSNIDGKSLDKQQRLVVVSHDTHSLALAGAGSGKTLTLAAKVKYLVDVKKMNPKDILLISFTAKSAEEMKHRITEKLKLSVDVMTFHKLGLGIISHTNGFKSDISDDPITIIKDYFSKEVLENSEVIDAIIEYLSYFLRVPTIDEDKKNLGEILEESGGFDNETIRSKLADNQDILDEIFIDDLKRQRITIKKETVKSMEEVQIANFLYLNGIEYEYERPYEIDTRTPEFSQYKPDFYLSDYRIYIEHFGMNKDHKVPWLPPIEAKRYVESYQWKIDTHEANHTKLIQTFSYYNKEGILINKLKEQLEGHGIKFYIRDKVELYKKLYLDKKDSYFDELIKLISTFISLLKSNKFGQKDIEKFIDNTKEIKDEYMQARSLCFLEIVRYVFNYYEQRLIESGAIDFNDMLNMATDMVDNNTPIHPYRMIIVDEFQDTSLSRYRLVLSLLKRTKAKLLCVGDDWQSIYRFAGSDLKVFTDFKAFFGSEHLLRIENTYRNPQKLIDIAGKFVMDNPFQFKKNLVSVIHTDDVPITIIGHDVSPINGLKKAIDDIVLRRPSVSEILLIGRNNFDISFLDDFSEFRVSHHIKDKTCSITYMKYPRIKFSFLTAHRSKGLEAEVTIILNVNNSLLGFPNKIADDPILEYVLTQKDDYLYGEERRLFYVALTRTKSFTYILTRHMKQSVFVREMIEQHMVPYIYIENPDYINHVVKCPVCITGHLVERSGNGNKFVSCTNFKYGCTFKSKHTEILDKPVKCPFCGGFMVERRRKRDNQQFLACNNYPHCTYAQDIDEKPDDQEDSITVGFDDEINFIIPEKRNSRCNL